MEAAGVEIGTLGRGIVEIGSGDHENIKGARAGSDFLGDIRRQYLRREKKPAEYNNRPA